MRVNSPSTPSIGRAPDKGFRFPSISGGAGGTGPACTVAPSITGTTTVGSTLTGNEGTWTGTPTLTASWLRDGAVIAGATGTTYVLVSADVGHDIVFKVLGSNAYGSTSAVSAAVGPVTDAGSYTPSLDFSDSRNSMYLPIAA